VRSPALTSWNLRAVLKEQPNLAIKLLEEMARRLRETDAAVTQ
jgi:hypothetical protein